MTIHTEPADDEYTRSVTVGPGERAQVEQPFPIDLTPTDLAD